MKQRITNILITSISIVGLSAVAAGNQVEFDGVIYTLNNNHQLVFLGYAQNYQPFLPPYQLSHNTSAKSGAQCTNDNQS
jgi:hypothetical protein